MNDSGQPTAGMVPFVKEMKPVLLVRRPDFDETEFNAAKPYFDVVAQRTEIPPHRTVVGRYSVLPLYRELATDVRNMRGRLINSSVQHNYIADIRNWVQDLREMTPRTWEQLVDVPDDAFPIIVKGETNSFKERWLTHCFAEDRRAAVRVMLNLQADSALGRQKLYFRQYVPLKTYFRSVTDIPVTKEFRFFVAHGKILAGGFYWQNQLDDFAEFGIKPPETCEVPEAFLREAVRRVGDSARFYAIDVAETKKGDWIVIELNDGQMSGLSCVDPDILYRHLWKTVRRANA